MSKDAENAFCARLADAKDLPILAAAEREAVVKWDHDRACYQAELQAYQVAYHHLHDRRSAVYAKARDDLRWTRSKSASARNWSKSAR